MYSSRMRTARAMTGRISGGRVHTTHASPFATPPLLPHMPPLCHACPPLPHMPPFAIPPPPFTTHAPLHHACPPLPCMPPFTTHALLAMHAPPEQLRTPQEQPCMPPRATTHTPWEQPCTPPPRATTHAPLLTESQTGVKT